MRPQTSEIFSNKNKIRITNIETVRSQSSQAKT